MIWLALTCTTAAGIVIVFAIIARLHGRISRRTFYALCAAANLTNLIVAAARTDMVSGPINAAALALTVWLWWHDGGGDDTKRRLREWGRKFQGVRRTAPVGAA